MQTSGAGSLHATDVGRFASFFRRRDGTKLSSFATDCEQPTEEGVVIFTANTYPHSIAVCNCLNAASGRHLWRHLSAEMFGNSVGGGSLDGYVDGLRYDGYVDFVCLAVCVSDRTSCRNIIRLLQLSLGSRLWR